MKASNWKPGTRPAIGFGLLNMDGSLLTIVGKVRAGTQEIAPSMEELNSEQVVGSIERITDLMSEISAAGHEPEAGIEQTSQAVTASGNQQRP